MQTTRLVKPTSGYAAVLLIAGLGVWSAGCGDIPEDSDDTGAAAEPAIVTHQSALTSPANGVLWFRWSKGEPTKVLAPFATHVCGLSMVRGQLWRETTLTVSRIGTNWVLYGSRPGGNYLQADAVCVPLSAFTVDPGVVPQNMGIWSANIRADANATVSTALPANHAPIFLGLQGLFRGGGERASIVFGPNPSVEARSENAPGPHATFAGGLYLGPKQPFVVFDAGTRVPSLVGSDLYLGGSDSIAPLATSFCYLVAVSGDFDGADEWAQVFPDAERGQWRFRANTGFPGDVYASAQCLKMDQRHPTIIIR